MMMWKGVGGDIIWQQSGLSLHMATADAVTPVSIKVPAPFDTNRIMGRNIYVGSLAKINGKLEF